MLHKEAVEPATLELIKTLQQEPLFKDFFLVGGTELALQVGHRKSADIDLLSIQSFEVEYLISYMEKEFEFELNYSQNHTIKGTISGIYVDLISHNYPFVEKPLEIEGFAFYQKRISVR